MLLDLGKEPAKVRYGLKITQIRPTLYYLNNNNEDSDR